MFGAQCTLRRSISSRIVWPHGDSELSSHACEGHAWDQTYSRTGNICRIQTKTINAQLNMVSSHSQSISRFYLCFSAIPSTKWQPNDLRMADWNTVCAHMRVQCGSLIFAKVQFMHSIIFFSLCAHTRDGRKWDSARLLSHAWAPPRDRGTSQHNLNRFPFVVCVFINDFNWIGLQR